MVSLLNSQGMKSCKSRESFCLSILFTQMIGPLFDMFTSAMFIFSFVRFLNTSKPRISWPTAIIILWNWASKPDELVGDSECRLTRFHPIRNFLANKIYLFSKLLHQTGCLFTWQPAPYNQLLIQLFLFVSKCYFA